MDPYVPPGTFVDLGDGGNLPIDAAFFNGLAAKVSELSTLPVGGREVAYAEITSSYAPTLTANIPQDIVGLDNLSVTVGARPIMLEFGCATVTHGGGAAPVQVWIVDVALGTRVGMAAASISSGGQINFNFSTRVAPAAGTRTYKAQIYSTLGGVVTVYASGSPSFPAFLQAREV